MPITNTEAWEFYTTDYTRKYGPIRVTVAEGVMELLDRPRKAEGGFGLGFFGQHTSATDELEPIDCDALIELAAKQCKVKPPSRHEMLAIARIVCACHSRGRDLLDAWKRKH